MVLLYQSSGVYFKAHACPRGSRRLAFTLVELLVVLFLLILLATIALPNLRRALVDQKASRASRSVLSFIDVARSRAIAEGREIGVRFERLAPDDVGAAISIRCRQLTGVPPYSGESSDASVVLADEDGGLPGVDTAICIGNEHQLLIASAQMLASADSSVMASAPIQPNQDRLELPGGKVVRITRIFADPPGSSVVKVRFNLTEPVDSPTSLTRVYPSGSRAANAGLLPGQRVKYRIHRSPKPSSSITVSLPKGVVFDLNYSGIGPRGNNFIPAGGTGPLDVIFGPDGRVSRVRFSDNTTAEPAGQIFLCLGDINGVRPGELLSNVGRDRGNLFREKTLWIVINQYTGRASSSPISPVSEATLNSGQPDDVRLADAIQEARALASLSDKVEGI